jgi:ferredoxin
VKVRVDAALCVGHGRCYEIAPAVFGDDERGHCRLLSSEVAPEHREAARKAEANCPERAISLEEG